MSIISRLITVYYSIVCVYIYIFIYMYMYMYVCIHICVYIYICIHIYIYIYIYMSPWRPMAVALRCAILSGRPACLRVGVCVS